MKKIIFITFISILFFSIKGYSHEKENIIIDTDCSIDDLRAICELIAIDEVNILAILTSDGTLSPSEGSRKVASLLTSLNILNIPIGTGKDLQIAAPIWRPFAEDILWGNKANDSLIDKSGAVSLFINKINASDLPITIFCFGPLTNIAAAIEELPEFSTKIKRIIWYNESINPLSGFNYERDVKAADFLFNKGIQIDVISDLNKKGTEFSYSFLEEIGNKNNKIIQIITSIHKQSEVSEKIKANHLKLWDDLLPVYFLFPDVFSMEKDVKVPNISINKDYDVNIIKEKLLHIYYQDFAFSNEVVFLQFPTDSCFFAEDIKKSMNDIIRFYGKEEWKKCVLTNEIHGHLGTYSIIGAKMGVKACEYLNAEVDRVSVVSNAGNKPPLSCMNDGLQISTGATLGLGMISISNDTIKTPSAIFSYNGKKIKIVLKEEVQKQITNDINGIINKYGALTPAYWEAVRTISIKYWQKYDRNKIFDIIAL
ncbi:MAG: hypothetical protein HGB12_07845 [Bacteroidetes bacterium]|nr:hypothetical protein [Bacteroidota bacterium]